MATASPVRKQVVQAKGMDPVVLLGCILVVAAALTWVVPAGQYKRTSNSEGDALAQVVPGSYVRVPRHPVGVGGVLESIPQGLERAASIVFYVLLAGAALTVVEATGAVASALDALAKYFVRRPIFILPVVSLLFLFGGASYGMSEEIIAFIPLLCALMRRLKLPNTMAVAVSLGSASVAGTYSPFNTYLLGISQPMAGLPLFSGFWYRSMVFVLATLTWLGYLMRQAYRTSVDQQGETFEPQAVEASDHSRINNHHYLVLLILNAGLAIMIVGAIVWSWDVNQFCAVFIAIAVLAGLAGGLKLRGTSEAFAEGLRRVTLAAVLVGVARAVSVILEQGLILDTITEILFRPLHHISRLATGVMMLASQSALNFPMPSQAGQAMLGLPILIPLADLLHVSRQVVVLVYQYATLTSDVIAPTYGGMLAMLAVAQVPFTKWLRFILPIYLILFAISAVAIVVAIHVGLS